MSDLGEHLQLTVPNALDGERVDRGLALLAGLTRAQAARLVAEGRARVGGKAVVSGSRRLHSGEVLDVELPATVVDVPGATPAHSEGEGAGPSTSPAARVVYVDADLVVVDKPPGLVVHPGAGNSGGTLVQQLLELFPDMAGAGPEGDRPGIVHRLDKGTSGLLVVARSAPAREGLVRQMKARSAERRYLALVHGQVEGDEGVIDAPLARSQSQRLRMAVVHGGRSARTHYQVNGQSGAPLPATLVTCRLETGRTHQVRVHFAAIGHPVVGDVNYSKPNQVQLVRQVLPELHRPWLHAARLGFVHPSSGEAMSFTSPLPPDLHESLALLGLSPPVLDDQGA